MRSIIFVSIALLLFPPLLHAGWFGYDSYEDCMLDKMKGQPQSMLLNADRFCKKKMAVEFPISVGSVEFNFQHEPGQTKVTLKPHADYEITKGTFVFSEKSCEEVRGYDENKGDWSQAEDIIFKSNEGYFTYSIRTMLCGKALSYKGRYK